VTDNATAYAAADRNAKDTLNALTVAATPAPGLALDMAIALRRILDRHRPRTDGTNGCTADCGASWPCPDAAAILRVYGEPDPDEDAP
jgi:hypothetical protein